MLDTVLHVLQTPLIVLSGTPVSAATILAALAIVVVSRIAAALIARSLERVLGARGVEHGLMFAMGKITRYVVFTIGVLVAIGSLGIDTSAIMAGGAVLLVGIGFGLQKLAENFISGLLVLISRPVRKGDFIDVGGVSGTVDDIGLRATRVISRDGVAVIVPNANLINGTVINHSVPTTSRRIWIDIGVAYGTDLDHATRVLNDVARADPGVVDVPAPEVRHKSFGDSAIELALVVWIDEPHADLIVGSRLRFAIDRAFRESAITIPFPQRDVHLKRTS